MEAAAHYPFRDDNAACFIARRIILTNGATVEVWEGTRLVYRTETDALISKDTLISKNVSIDVNDDPEPRA